VSSKSLCLSIEDCLSYVAGESTGPTAQNVQLHVETCAACRVVMAEAARATVMRSQPSQPGAVPRTLRSGERLLDRYEIRRFIAKGGMGEVYEAFDAALSETVALKTLPLANVDQAAAVSGLLSEVRLARKVTHPNVCRILEFGVHRSTGRDGDPVPFLTMELLAGETLARTLARVGRFSPDTVAKILSDVLTGLEAIHAAGIVHRDLKSENIFMVPGVAGHSRAIVMDFGLAQLQRLRDDSRGSTDDSVVGTLDYMAPEQLNGRGATQASDIYALGVIAFELLTGRRPFVGGTQFGRAATRLVADPPRPSALRTGLGAKWDLLVSRCLQRDPAQRPKNVGAVRSALEEVGSRSRPAISWAGLAASVALALVASGWVLRSHRASEATISVAAPAPEGPTGVEARSGEPSEPEPAVPRVQRPERPAALRAERDGDVKSRRRRRADRPLAAAMIERPAPRRGAGLPETPAAPDDETADEAASKAAATSSPHSHPDDLLDPFGGGTHHDE
jgi:serine/threonine protein kinase